MLKGIQLDSLFCFVVVWWFLLFGVFFNTSSTIIQHGYFHPLKQLFLPECELDREIQAFITDGLSYFSCTLHEPRFMLITIHITGTYRQIKAVVRFLRHDWRHLWYQYLPVKSVWVPTMGEGNLRALSIVFKVNFSHLIRN